MNRRLLALFAVVAIVDGRLIHNKNASIREAFDEDRAGLTRDADANWPKLVEKKGR